MVLPFYEWSAPAWTGANRYPELYRAVPRTLLVCALLDHATTALDEQAARETARIDPFAEDDPRWSAAGLLPVVHDYLGRAQRVFDQLTGLRDAAGTVEHLTQRLVCQCRLILGSPSEDLHPRAWLTRVWGKDAQAHIAQDETQWRKARRVLAGMYRNRRKVLGGLLDLDEGDLPLVMRAHRLVGFAPCRIPRAAPGEPDAGQVRVPVAASFTAARALYALSRADTLLTQRPADPSLADIRGDRQELLRRVEHAAQLAGGVESDASTMSAWIDLVGLCGRIARHFHLDEEDFQLMEGKQVRALELLVRLEQEDSATAALACARLRMMLNLAPLVQPQMRPIEDALSVFLQQDWNVLDRLEGRLAEELDS